MQTRATTAALLAAFGFVATGCRKSELPPPPPRPVTVAPQTAPAQPGPAASAPATTQGSSASFERPLDVEALDAALRNYEAQHDRVPRTVEEMAALKLIPRVPTPPPGKRYVIDPQKRRIQVVNR